MTVYTLIEENYKNSIWCRQTLSGMRYAVKKKRYELTIFESKEDALLTLKENDAKIILLLGTSQKFMLDAYEYFTKENIHCVFISCQPDKLLKNTSSVLIDHSFATHACLTYLSDCKKDKTALYGINPDSFADNVKKECFISEKNEKDIYYNEGNLEKCFNQFFPNIKNYNSVICANDIAAISLIKNLTEKGFNVPKDIFVISFGNTVLGKYFEPSVTSVTLNFADLGNQAVLIYSYLTKSDTEVNITLKIPCEITAGKTTDFISPAKSGNKALSSPPKTADFYDDETVYKINNIESLLNECEDIDFKILYLLLEGKKYEEISAVLFSSENTVKYRIKRMMKFVMAESKNEFVEIISSYIDKNRLIF